MEFGLMDAWKQVNRYYNASIQYDVKHCMQIMMAQDC